MSNLNAIITIDSREPNWIQKLDFGGLPTEVKFMEISDLKMMLDDGHTLLIERKTPEDFLGSLKSDRLFSQLARMTEDRNTQQLLGQPITSWPFLVITELFKTNNAGMIITDRGITGWAFASVMGAILSVQEMGVFVIFCNGQNDYENCILRLGRRNRDPEMKLLPPRPANIFGPKATFLAGLPGIGIEMVQKILDWSANNPADALIGLTDMEIKSPIGLATRRRIRDLLCLQDDENFEKVRIMQKEKEN